MPQQKRRKNDLSWTSHYQQEYLNKWAQVNMMKMNSLFKLIVRIFENRLVGDQGRHVNRANEDYQVPRGPESATVQHNSVRHS